MSKYERLSSSIPVDNDWKLKDIEKKAEELKLDKNDFIIKAVDMLMNFDNEFIKYIEKYSKGLKIPEYLVIQNMIIKQMADKEAKKEVYGELQELLEEFMVIHDEKGPRTATGQELKKILKDKAVREYKKELEKLK